MTLKFKDLGLSNQLILALNQQNITEPTTIQFESIPLILNGVDIIGESQTGTGKTLAFLLPMFEKLNPSSPHLQGLVITPTRELAQQITDVASALNTDNAYGILAAYGGQDVGRQLKKLKKGVQLIIATPGRLMDLLSRNAISTQQLKMLVLDEADQMLLLGFKPEMEDILKQTPKQKQTLCYSATLDKQVKKIAYRYLKDPQEIRVKKETVTLDAIDQLVIQTTDRKKQDALKAQLDQDNPFMAIIFCRTRRRVDQLDQALASQGYDCEKLHGEVPQSKRNRTMKAFRDLKVQYLIATDVAARGLDISGVSHIYNYDIPESPEIYIHRIGRTGRAGETGKATTFVAPKDEELLQEIQQKIKQEIPSKGYL